MAYDTCAISIATEGIIGKKTIIMTDTYVLPIESSVETEDINGEVEITYITGEVS